MPYLEHKIDVLLAFDIFNTAQPLIKARNFMELTDEELLVKTDGWEKAKNWADWWIRSRILKMFTKSWKTMDDVDWAACPSTTNAIESHNKIKSFKNLSIERKHATLLPGR
jgi:hypothetical protein